MDFCIPNPYKTVSNTVCDLCRFFRKEDTEAKVEYDWSKYELGARCELNPGGRRPLGHSRSRKAFKEYTFGHYTEWTLYRRVYDTF